MTPAKPPAYVQATAQVGGNVSVTLNVEKLPVPPRAYHANVAFATLDGPNIAFVFGDRWPGERRLNSAVCVRMPARLVREALNPEFVGVLASVVEKSATLEPATPVGPAEYPSPDRRASENATLIAATFVDFAASLRFYRVSAPGFRRASAELDTDFVVPNVEVIMSAGLFAGLVQRTHELFSGEQKA